MKGKKKGRKKKTNYQVEQAHRQATIGCKSSQWLLINAFQNKKRANAYLKSGFVCIKR